MIIIYPERLSTGAGITANSESSNFPASNMEDDRPGRVWQADSTNVATVTIPAVDDTDSVALFNTNAISAACVLRSYAGSTALDSKNYDLTPASGRVHNRFFWSYSAQSTTCQVEVTLTATTGVTVQAGIARIGKGEDFVNPAYGIRQARQSLATVLEMSNRSQYVSQDPGDVETRRTIDVTILEDRNPDFYSFDTLLKHFGPNPMAVLAAEHVAEAADDFDDMEWAIYGYVNPKTLYSASHGQPKDSAIGFTLTEAI